MRTVTSKLLIVGALVMSSVGCLHSASVDKTGNSNASNVGTSAENIKLLNNQSSAVIPPSPDTLTIALLRKRKNKTKPVLNYEVFQKDDGVRLKISVVENGLMTVLYRGSDGDYQKLFPHESYNKGENSITVNQVLEIPDSGWFFFDAKKGAETIFVIYSKTAVPKELTTDPKSGVAFLEKIRLENNNADAFSTREGDLVRIVELKHE